MLGLQMDMPLLLSGLIEHAALYHGDTETVARTVEGTLFRYDYVRAHARAKQLAKALTRLGIAPDDVVFIEQMPMTATGKIHKLTLRERFKDYKLADA